MQKEVWEKEYRNLSLLTGDDKPQNNLRRFLKFLKKEQKLASSGLKVLDLGSGTGRNTNYMQSLGNECVGMEISETAINIAKRRAGEAGLAAKFINSSIGAKFPLPDNSVDLLLDVTSSNSLNNEERSIYLSEAHRVLKPGGYFFVKALALEGDKNAKNLIKLSPGHEPKTYIMPEIGLEERVFDRDDFTKLYSKYFQILKLDRKTSYTRMNNRSYKRNFWLAYLQKL